MKTDEPKKIYLQDYRPPDFEVQKVDLHFDLYEDFCRVQSTLRIRRLGTVRDLVLDGIDLQLEKITVDRKPWPSARYHISPESLTLDDVPDQFTLETVVKIFPDKNTDLEGLYRSGPMFCTQCEPQGFRKITYYLDRPDSMSQFTVTVAADKKKYPILLSNGNRAEQKDLPDGRHQVTWEDPFKKPAYLFALVAGDLGVIHDSFTTFSEKKIGLEIYAPHGQQERCWHAMECLKKAMKWDEERFGREYDLTAYLIVAVDDFNAGAMENKGLNIFNSRLVLADPISATDSDYFNIESVIAHEYFHNWTGNRVTLRDWFELSLKEGLTVFRDQEFSMDVGSRAVVRIESVNDLRQKQFSEDAGPNAHPIRPESCYAVDNFFTPTIYEKGAEVIRMMQTMVGRPGFRKGMDLYFSRYDGQAVTIEDFAQAIADANEQHWDQFQLWYSQAGTPTVTVEEDYDPVKKSYHLTLRQSCGPSPGQVVKKPFLIPLLIGLLRKDGSEVNLRHPDVTVNSEGQKILYLRDPEKTLLFHDLPEKPVLSLNRQFSAPVHLQWRATDEELLHLLAYDSDDFNRWEAGQILATQNLLVLTQAAQAGRSHAVSPALLAGLQKVLDNRSDPALQAMILQLPEDSYLVQMQAVLHAPAMSAARVQLELGIANGLQTLLRETYENLNGKNPHSRDPLDFGRRHLKNTALFYLSFLPGGADLAFKQFQQAKIMTDRQAALQALCDSESSLREQALQEFRDQWKNDTLVLNKWFALQASSRRRQTFSDVVKLWDHVDFNKKNPNRVYSLLWRFGENIPCFHDPTQPTYEFFADKIIEIDRYNPQVATRLSGSFNLWVKLPTTQKASAGRALQKMLRSNLSKNTYEIVSKALKAEDMAPTI